MWVLPAFGDARLDRIDPIAVETWITDMKQVGLSPSRIRQAHQALNAVLKAAVKNKYLASNPAEGVSLPRIRTKEQRFLTSDQLDDPARAIEEPYGTWSTSWATEDCAGEKPPPCADAASTSSEQEWKSPNQSQKSPAS